MVKWNKVKKILHFLSTIFLYSLLMILTFLILVVGSYLLDYNLNVKTGKFTQPLFGAYIIISESMVPNININDAVITNRVAIDDLKVGDVIIFTSSSSVSEGITVTHRIIGIVQSQDTGKVAFRTKGDDNFSPDGALADGDNVIGKVILTIPKIGYIHSLLVNNIKIVMIIVLFGLFIVIHDFVKYSIKKQKKNNRRKSK